MSEEPKRLIEIRLIAMVVVDVRHPDLINALQHQHVSPSITDVVAAEVSSNLESVSYVASALVCRL